MILVDPYRFGAAFAAALVASTYFDVQVSGSAQATFTLAATGQAAGGPNVLAGGDDAYAWLLEGAAAGLEVVVALDVGTFSSGSGEGTHNLGTTRSWSVTRSSNGTKTATATFTIQLAGGGAVLATASVTLQATIDAGSGGGGGPGGGGDPV